MTVLQWLLELAKWKGLPWGERSNEAVPSDLSDPWGCNNSSVCESELTTWLLLLWFLDKLKKKKK